MTATIINLYGGPGTGKSTAAAEVFARLKRLGYSAELVTEYAKDLTYQKSFHKMRDQGYVFATQHHRVWQSADSVDWIITDSPLLLSLVYSSDTQYDTPEFRRYVISVYERYDNIDIFLERNIVEHPYQEYGRTQTLDEAIDIDKQVDDLLRNAGVLAHRVEVSHTTVEEILKIIGV